LEEGDYGVSDELRHRSRGEQLNESIVRELRTVADQVDPLPSSLKAAARAALSWRTVDAELAELAADSFDDRSTALARGGQAPRLLSFEASGATITLEVLVAAGRRHLVGQLDPAQPAEVEVRQPGGTRTVQIDQLGRFVADVSAGPVSLRCHVGGTSSGPAVVTDWVVI
jgi:hypothetical protein